MKRYDSEINCQYGNVYEDKAGPLVFYVDAQKEIATRDARIAELEIARNAQIYTRITEEKESLRRLAAVGERDKRIAILEKQAVEWQRGVAQLAAMGDARIAELQTEIDDWVHANKADRLERRIAELEADLKVQRAFLSLAEGRINAGVAKRDAEARTRAGDAPVAKGGA